MVSMMAEKRSDKLSAPPVRYAQFEKAGQVNSGLLSAYNRLSRSNCVRRTHHFFGRFENTYVDSADLPEVSPIVDFVVEAARRYTGESRLHHGYWFNEMQPGQRTSRHSHAEMDECLSAVYYVSTPENCGSLLLYQPPLTINVTPRAGLLVLFPPDMEHEVTPNASDAMRLSIAFNFGLMDGLS
jgi:hypothetical protein